MVKKKGLPLGGIAKDFLKSRKARGHFLVGFKKARKGDSTLYKVGHAYTFWPYVVIGKSLEAAGFHPYKNVDVRFLK